MWCLNMLGILSYLKALHEMHKHTESNETGVCFENLWPVTLLQLIVRVNL